MKAIRKRPGQGPEIVDIQGKTDIQREIGDYLDCAALSSDTVIYWDGKWKENGKQPNEILCGLQVGGTMLMVGNGVKGELIDVPSLDAVLFALWKAVRYGRADRAHNVWNCRHCGHMEQFEADGPFENGWNLCPVCGGWILRPHNKGASNEV